VSPPLHHQPPCTGPPFAGRRRCRRTWEGGCVASAQKHGLGTGTGAPRSLPDPEDSGKPGATKETRGPHPTAPLGTRGAKRSQQQTLTAHQGGAAGHALHRPFRLLSRRCSATRPKSHHFTAIPCPPKAPAVAGTQSRRGWDTCGVSQLSRRRRIRPDLRGRWRRAQAAS
jgi:hypothetical protein